jgi:hypothetical protein
MISTKTRLRVAFEFAVEDLFAETDVEFAVGNSDDDLTAMI